MAKRNCRIAVSESEKSKLDEIAAQEFGDAGAPYGAIINYLANQYNTDN